MSRGGTTKTPALVGGAVAVVGIGVVKAAGVAKNHEADAEEHCQQW